MGARARAEGLTERDAGVGRAARNPGASVNEQSHKHDMAAAVRGDFARLRARGVSTTIEIPDEPTLDEQAADELPPAEPAPVTPVTRRRLRLLRRG